MLETHEAILNRLRDEQGNFTLDFHLPVEYNDSSDKQEKLIALDEVDETNLHRQLVCWCLIQRFWYYVLDLPQVTDREYDYVERCVADLEAMYPQLDNRYSPTQTLGSSVVFSYPTSITNGVFCKAHLGCYHWQYRSLLVDASLPPLLD